MTAKLTLDYSGAQKFFRSEELTYLEPKVEMAHKMLHERTGPGHDFLGWLEWPFRYDQVEFGEIKKAAARIHDQAEVLVVVGIGGSYLGARAAIELLSPAFVNSAQGKAPQILYAGNHLSADYLSGLLDYLREKDFAVNVISKSGTTTEPAVAFRFLKKLLEEKYGKTEAAQRIYATTDRKRGALRELAAAEGYTTFVIPDDIGGRYSVLTPVGLLPIAAAGIDIDEIMSGAAEAAREYSEKDLAKNQAYQYAALRQIFYDKGKTVELLVSYEPALHYFAEWWKQLFGESEGKDQKGLFPAACDFTTDLHSLGQFIQDGKRLFIETVLRVERPRHVLAMTAEEQDLDGLNYLAGKTVDFINEQALRGTIMAHVEGGVPNLLLNIPELKPYYFGQMVYFFKKACAVSGYLLGVNPFDQPGVEFYKKNMFTLLGKK
ncbi:MAG TPA: glucose-6-phosphate isomerase [Firmicutes bacterium]|nr:glucose-6-phosphate isomerase [Bacillota bacterium]